MLAVSIRSDHGQAACGHLRCVFGVSYLYGNIHLAGIIRLKRLWPYKNKEVCKSPAGRLALITRCYYNCFSLQFFRVLLISVVCITPRVCMEWHFDQLLVCDRMMIKAELSWVFWNDCRLYICHLNTTTVFISRYFLSGTMLTSVYTNQYTGEFISLLHNPSLVRTVHSSTRNQVFV